MSQRGTDNIEKEQRRASSENERYHTLAERILLIVLAVLFAAAMIVELFVNLAD